MFGANYIYFWLFIFFKKPYLRYFAYFSNEEEPLSSFSSLELELWFVESRLAICEANCLLRSSLYLAIRRSEMVFEPEPKFEKMKKVNKWSNIWKNIFLNKVLLWVFAFEFSFMLLKSTEIFNSCLKMFILSPLGLG